MSADQEPKTSKKKFLTRPVLVAIGIVGSLASLISIPLAVLFYFQSREYPRLTYFVHPVKTVILQSGTSPKLAATYENQPIKDDVTSAQIAMWNQGTQSIRSANILKPIVIYTKNGSQILEAIVRKNSRDVTQVTLETEEAKKGRIGFSFKILEPGDGAVVQVIYAGTTQVSFGVDGVIEGQKQISEQVFPSGIKSAQEQYEASRKSIRTTAAVMLLFSILVLVGVIIVTYMRRKLAAGDVQLDQLIQETKEAAEAAHNESVLQTLAEVEASRQQVKLKRFLWKTALGAMAALVMGIVGMFLSISALLLLGQQVPPFEF